MTGKQATLHEALEEEAFYNVALDPSLDMIDIGIDDNILGQVMDDKGIKNWDKTDTRLEPWRSNDYDPYRKLLVNDDQEDWS